MNERRRLEREMDDEIRIHLAHRVDALVARGMPRHNAEEEAMRRFGPLHTGRAEMLAAARHRDRVLTMHDYIDSFRHDASYALRQIWRAPALAGVIIVTFALGIGANATMFGLIDRLLFRPPAYVSRPEQLVRAEMKYRFPERDEFTSSSFSYPAYTAVRDNVPAFASAAMQTYPNPISFGLGAAAHPIQHIIVSGNYFSTLGTPMALGRPILPADDVPPNGSAVVVIGHAMWQRELGGKADVLGTTIDLAGRRFTIIGVAPADFVGVGRRPIDVWIPVAAAEGIRFAGSDWATNRGMQWMSVIARLKTGTSAELAGEQVAAALRALNAAATGKPDTNTRAAPAASILPNKATTLSPDSRVAVLLGSVSVLVVLIASANIANLLLARALRRRREIAVRLALGISRARLMRQLLLEGVALALLGGIASLVIVQYGGVFIYRVLLADSARPTSFIDLRVLVFTIAATLFIGLVTALVPAIQASGPSLTGDLKEGTRGAGVSHSRTRVALLVAQAALSVVLLAGTGAFVVSLRNVTTVSLGLDIDRLVYGRIDLRSVGFDSVRSIAYFNAAVDAARRLPGVESVAIAEAGPFTDWSLGIGLKIPGRDSVPAFERGPYRHGVSEDYFRTTRTRILRGRAFTPSDFSTAAEPVVIINADGARRLWPNEEAVGKCIALAEQDAPCARIVGVAEDTHMSEVIEKGTRLQVYNPLGHSVRVEPRAFTLLVRTSGDPAALVDPLRRMMQTVSSGLPYADVKPMAAMLDRELRPWRLGATLFGVFGAIALVLSALGLYSVVSYSVTQRTHEMGVRVALGAQVADIGRLVLTQGMGVAMVGVAIGVLLTLGGAGLVKPLLYETSARDPLVLVAVAVVLLSVAATASLIPARRAMRADPLSALRAE